MRRVAQLAAGLLVVAAAAPVLATAQAQRTVDADTETACSSGIVVDNDELSIRFDPREDRLVVTKKDDAGSGVDGTYRFTHVSVDELAGGTLAASLALEAGDPISQTCTVQQDGRWVNVTHRITDEVHTRQPTEVTPTADVVLEYRFDQADDEAKFDLEVLDWPWQGHEDHELAYRFHLASDWAIDPADDGLGLHDASTGEPEAYVQWAEQAQTHRDDGPDGTARVTANTTTEADRATTVLRFTGVEPGYERLDYDPRLAVGPYVIVGGELVPLTEPLEEPGRTVSRSETADTGPQMATQPSGSPARTFITDHPLDPSRRVL